MPSGIGLEGAGVVEAVGEGVTEVKVGDRVAYASGPIGAYAEVRKIQAHRLLILPDSIGFDTGAAMMLQGLTAAYLLRKTYRVQPGDAVLIHAAAGGVGLIACQWAKALGATVIGTVGSPTKAGWPGRTAATTSSTTTPPRTSPSGCARTSPMARRGGGYDGVGKDTFTGSLDSLRPMGMMVTYGNASGPVPPVDLIQLSQKGSLFITRPTLMTYTAKRADLLEFGPRTVRCRRQHGQVRIEVNQRFMP